jgi:DNA-binding GntR family transcriptional regulator
VTIDHEAEEPVYLQLARMLRERIASGEIRRRMPSLKAVQEEFGVAHGTVEKAFRVLTEEGLIRPVVGRGHFVRGREPE